MSETIGFIGVGTMGEPMCRNLARKSGMTVLAADRNPEPLQRLTADGVRTAPVDEIVASCRTIFLSLPGGKEVEQVCLGEGGILSKVQMGWTIVDTSTAPVALARRLYAEFEGKACAFADAPIARTRQAAIDGTLSIMVGASDELFARIAPLLRCMASDVTHCGPPGAGQAVKLLNNMVLSVTVMALAEALAVAKASGAVDPQVLFETLMKGSADSFALRNHGMKSLLPETHPEKAFPVNYMMKDVGYALELARSAGLDLLAGGSAMELLSKTKELGLGEAYHTAIIEAVRKRRVS